MKPVKNKKAVIKNLNDGKAINPCEKHEPAKFIIDKEGKLRIFLAGVKKGGLFGTRDEDLINVITDQLMQVCLRGNAESISKRDVEITNAALASVGELEPMDSTELMLATQMAAVHTMAMKISRGVIIVHNEYSADTVDRSINQVTKLMRTFTTQMEALNKYRTKGQQKITVQHVNVNDGGQAVIGDINQGGGNG